ncbi:hypothetical protein AA313_de0205965 [Arthrobotrys entomopaga]|nr:hypothetical protein AA313_de0205965 [Arthrobotrys entomopaga]
MKVATSLLLLSASTISSVCAAPQYGRNQETKPDRPGRDIAKRQDEGNWNPAGQPWDSLWDTPTTGKVPGKEETQNEEKSQVESNYMQTSTTNYQQSSSISYRPTGSTSDRPASNGGNQLNNGNTPNTSSNGPSSSRATNSQLGPSSRPSYPVNNSPAQGSQQNKYQNHYQGQSSAVDAVDKAISSSVSSKNGYYNNQQTSVEAAEATSAPTTTRRQSTGYYNGHSSAVEDVVASSSLPAPNRVPDYYNAKKPSVEGVEVTPIVTPATPHYTRPASTSTQSSMNDAAEKVASSSVRYNRPDYYNNRKSSVEAAEVTPAAPSSTERGYHNRPSSVEAAEIKPSTTLCSTFTSIITMCSSFPSLGTGYRRPVPRPSGSQNDAVEKVASTSTSSPTVSTTTKAFYIPGYNKPGQQKPEVLSTTVSSRVYNEGYNKYRETPVFEARSSSTSTISLPIASPQSQTTSTSCTSSKTSSRVPFPASQTTSTSCTRSVTSSPFVFPASQTTSTTCTSSGIPFPQSQTSTSCTSSGIPFPQSQTSSTSCTSSSTSLPFVIPASQTTTSCTSSSSSIVVPNSQTTSCTGSTTSSTIAVPESQTSTTCSSSTQIGFPRPPATSTTCSSSTTTSSVTPPPSSGLPYNKNYKEGYTSSHSSQTTAASPAEVTPGIESPKNKNYNHNYNDYNENKPKPSPQSSASSGEPLKSGSKYYSDYNGSKPQTPDYSNNKDVAENTKPQTPSGETTYENGGNKSGSGSDYYTPSKPNQKRCMQKWVGTAPVCGGADACEEGWTLVRNSKEGANCEATTDAKNVICLEQFGSRCITGQKALCEKCF